METLWEYPEGEGSTRQRVIRGRITPYPFIYNLWQKWYPCVICIICKWHPFYILIWNLSCWRSSASEILSGFHIPTAWKRQLCRSRSEGLSWLFAENNDKSFFQLFQFLFGVRVRHHCWLLFQAAATWPKKGNPFGWSLPVLAIIASTPTPPTPRMITQLCFMTQLYKYAKVFLSRLFLTISSSMSRRRSFLISWSLMDWYFGTNTNFVFLLHSSWLVLSSSGNN